MMNKLEELYRAVWTQMFRDILGWSEPEVLAWAKEYDEYLKDPEDMFYHADPPYWTVSAFISVEANQHLSTSERCSLRNKILSVFPVELYVTSYLNVDWKQYKSKIHSIIEDYAP